MCHPTENISVLVLLFTLQKVYNIICTLNSGTLLIRHHLLNYLLTYSMVQSPSWEVIWFAASQEIPRISRNPKVHYLTHKRPPTVSILGQPNPVHIPTSHLLEIRPNIIHPSTPRSPQWSLSLRFPQQDPIHIRHHLQHVYILHSLSTLADKYIIGFNIGNR